LRSWLRTSGHHYPGPGRSGQHDAAGNRQPARTHELGNLVTESGILDQVPDAVAEVIEQRPAPAEQQHHPDRAADDALEAVEAIFAGGKLQQAADHQQAADREGDAGGAMRDGGHHLHLLAVDLQMRGKRSLLLCHGGYPLWNR